MHGASRAAERYVRAAAPVAERHDALAVVIHFPKSRYPKSSSYTLGVTALGSADGEAYAQGRWREPTHYIYAEVEAVFSATRQLLGGQQTGYYLFGHSAGAQFTHRLLTFLPQPRVLAAVAANAGWYTLPVRRAERDYTMPYGLNGSPVTDADIEALLSAPLSVLLGERDTATPADSRLVRGSSQAMAQSDNRLERGQHYFRLAEAQAQRLGVPFRWHLAFVPRAGHDAAEMIDSAAHYLFGSGDPPCRPSAAADASGLVITELLADPPDGPAGDVNGDGRRDPAEDEFVEIVNAGETSLCLAGWALGDGKRAERHVFPLGASLPPGAALVIFGGGVPTGDFGGAGTFTAQFGGKLSLTNDGDVLTLRDAADELVQQVSWGDCGRRSCVTDHFADSLGNARSLTREARPGSAWREHDPLPGGAFSPGLRTDGLRWEL
jgi:dienelactone hydrolase